jgi:hypothetical protein
MSATGPYGSADQLTNLITGEFSSGHTAGQTLINRAGTGTFAGGGLNLELVEIHRPGDHGGEDQDHEQWQYEGELHSNYAAVRRPPT